MAKLNKDDLFKLNTLDDATRADLAARFDEIADLEKKVQDITKQKADADVYVTRAGEAEKAVKERDQKIADLQNELARHTGKPADEISLTLFAPFFGEDLWT
jgi:hypothetical protein